MKHPTRAVLALVVAVMGLMPGRAQAQTTLVSENFQSPSYANGTYNPLFAGWTWGVLNYLKSVTASGTPDVPVDVAGNNSNQAIHIENITTLTYTNITQTWARGEAYRVTINASPMSWNGTFDRYIIASLLQTNGVVLWSRSALMPKYPTSAPYFGQNPWTAAQTFTNVILSDAFTTGTTGQLLRLQITQGGARGIYVDNVKLEKLAAPPPDTTVPAPDPMTWYLVPTPVGGRSITMIASTAVDDNYAVQYLFTNTTTGASSGWQSSPGWTNTGLDDATAYTYKVKVRDTSPNNNETGWSTSLSATTKDPKSLELVAENFQIPLYSDGTYSPYFVGWKLTGPLSARRGGGDGAPGPATNQLIHFEWTGLGWRAEYDCYYNWARRKTYTLTLNAAPQVWSGSGQRYFVADILQTNGVLLWTSGDVAVPLANPPAYTNYQGQPWPPALTFSYAIESDSFTNGTAGQPVRVRIYTAGTRGTYVDNVRLTLARPRGTVVVLR